MANKPLIQTTKVDQHRPGQEAAKIITNEPATTVAGALKNAQAQVAKSR
jgi:hypothetical protein